MSPILPTDTTARPAFERMSRIVSPGGGVAKSLRLPVRVKPPAAVPMNGRAMTRPIRYASQSERAIRHRLVKPLEPKSFLVGRDLQDGVDRRVEDRLSGPQMLGAEFVDDGGSGGVLVAEDPGKLRLTR